MAVEILQLFTFEFGDFDLLLEDGGTYRISTLAAANVPIGVIAGGNCDLVILGGQALSIVIDPTNVGPDGSNQLFAYAGVGGTKVVCKSGGGTEVIVSNGGT